MRASMLFSQQAPPNRGSVVKQSKALVLGTRHHRRFQRRVRPHRWGFPMEIRNRPRRRISSLLMLEKQPPDTLAMGALRSRTSLENQRASYDLLWNAITGPSMGALIGL